MNESTEKVTGAVPQRVVDFAQEVGTFEIVIARRLLQKARERFVLAPDFPGIHSLVLTSEGHLQLNVWCEGHCRSVRFVLEAPPEPPAEPPAEAAAEVLP